MDQVMRPGQHTRAFSLIELIITLGLLIIMVVMMEGRGSRSYQQRQLAACNKNLQTIHLALQMYANDNRMAYPVVRSAETAEAPMSLLVPRYSTVTEIFICPGSKDKSLPEGEPFARRKISYAYYMGLTNGAAGALLSDRQVDTLPKKSGQKIFSADGKSPGSNHSKYGGNLLFHDGHVATSSPTNSHDLTFPTNVTLLNPRS
jgi:prepilin-type processing-associated H-X9-DG protein